MADDDLESRQPTGALTPVLSMFQGALPDHVIGRVQDYLMKRKLATENEQAGENFVRDITQFKDGLVSMVKKDPFAVHMANSIVPDVLKQVIGTMPGMPDDAETHHGIITKDFQREISAAAVTSMAEKDEGKARGLLEGLRDTLGEHADAMGNYIDMQAGARAQDRAAAEVRQAQLQDYATSRSALNYLNALYNPTFRQIQSPEGWNQAVLADPTLPPHAKVGVQALYNHLQENGDVPVSDPHLVSDIIHSVASDGPNPHPADIVTHAGDGLRFVDALHLANGALEPQSQAQFKRLDTLLTAASDTLNTPDNGVAGLNAFGRFTNWLMDFWQGGGDLHNEDLLEQPKTDKGLYKTLDHFQPSLQDYITTRDRTEQKSLDEIFTHGGPDVVIHEPMIPPEEGRRMGGATPAIRDLTPEERPPGDENAFSPKVQGKPNEFLDRPQYHREIET